MGKNDLVDKSIQSWTWNKRFWNAPIHFQYVKSMDTDMIWPHSSCLLVIHVFKAKCSYPLVFWHYHFPLNVGLSSHNNFCRFSFIYHWLTLPSLIVGTNIVSLMKYILPWSIHIKWYNFVISSDLVCLHGFQNLLRPWRVFRLTQKIMQILLKV